MLCSVVLLALFASTQGRAVNISNTWVLPEEGFPVFYRYFRDRISWYEADAVCQFHHANLVTVDTTAQYDAVRAYLKELDISSAVWVGLIRSNPDGDFTWTDYRGLSGDGYWSSAPDGRAAPLCAAADPAADYRWEARACGGPTVASFICELPVPQWALGNEGCMVRALPALTILYLPESAAVQLTADCGLAGVKRVQCTGSVKREDLLRELSCAEENDPSSTPSLISMGSTWPIATDAVFTDEDTTKEVTTEDNTTTEHEDDINQPSIKTATPTSYESNLAKAYKYPTKLTSANKLNKIILSKNVDMGSIHNNNLQSNYIPKLANEESFLTNEELSQLEDEKHMQHKMLHEEIARLGNLDNIFTQPTDHFVPPLVMAKSKISDDMTVLSLAEKHAQQLAEKQLSKQTNQYRQGNHVYVDNDNIKSKSYILESKEQLLNKTGTVSVHQSKIKENEKKDIMKNTVPKKYIEKYKDSKVKMFKTIDDKQNDDQKGTETTSTQTVTESTLKAVKTTTSKIIRPNTEEGPFIDLTVLIKDEPAINEDQTLTNYSGDIAKFEVIKNITANSFNETLTTSLKIEEDSISTTMTTGRHFDARAQNIAQNHEVIKITIISEDHSTVTPTMFEITTKAPFPQDGPEIGNNTVSITEQPLSDTSASDKINSNEYNNMTSYFNIDADIKKSMVTPASDMSTTTNAANITNNFTEFTKPATIENTLTTSTTTSPSLTTIITRNATESQFSKKLTEYVVTTNIPSSTSKQLSDEFNHAESHEALENNATNTEETIDDYQSPLLSAANEPLHRPNRSRRPQSPPNRNKFNPFRILG